ncbi:ribonuclease III [Nocardia suismassiliense]|uniref:ribonuclease III n=1 Tax=Nocardia suismassiliense TaxID=2077092 RepID=UPI001F1D23CF|nr:ribonuclease III [Nocardia suismassiliense]
MRELPRMAKGQYFEALLGVSLDAELLDRALTHRSFGHEHDVPHNERLEFVGSASVGVVVVEALYGRHPDLHERELSRLRLAIVNEHAIAEVARHLTPGGFGRYLRLGRGEAATGGRDKDIILAGALKAVIGAVQAQFGYSVSHALVLRLFESAIEDAGRGGPGPGPDWKTSLQEFTSMQGLGVPEYVVQQQDAVREQRFAATVGVGGAMFGPAHGRSKKEAQQRAAQLAWSTLTQNSSEKNGVPDSGSGARESRG